MKNKFIIILIVISILNIDVHFAGRRNNGVEVDEPVSQEDSKINVSEGIIYSEGNYIYNPINNGIPGFKQEEYDKVNNYEINFDTLDLRIKYFSPNYNKDKVSVINNDILSSGLRGKDITNITSNGLDEYSSTLILSRENLVNTIKVEILNYLSAKNKNDILNMQKNLYEKMYKAAEENLKNGMITSLEFNNIDLEFTNVKVQLENSKINMMNYKDNIAKYLGYNLYDEDKFIFIEPEVDLVRISNIDYDSDLQKMFMTDSNYINTIVAGDEGSNGSSKIPGSTGYVIYQKKVQAAYDNVEVNYESAFANLINKCRLYVNNLKYLVKISNLKESENENKYGSSLISETDYLRNKIQILTDRGNVNDSKYELLKAQILYDNNINLRYMD